MAANACGHAHLSFAWVRVFSTYGPTDDSAWMIPSLILSNCSIARSPHSPRASRSGIIYSWTTRPRPWPPSSRRPAATGIFNLGSGSAPRLREIVEAIRDTIDPALELGLGEIPYRPDQVMHLEADISRLKAATGWSPRVTLKEGMARTVEWYRTHR